MKKLKIRKKHKQRKRIKLNALVILIVTKMREEKWWRYSKASLDKLFR